MKPSDAKDTDAGADAAAAWFVRVDSGSEPAADAALADWLAERPANERAMERVELAVELGRRLAADPAHALARRSSASRAPPVAPSAARAHARLERCTGRGFAGGDLGGAQRIAAGCGPRARCDARRAARRHRCAEQSRCRAAERRRRRCERRGRIAVRGGRRFDARSRARARGRRGIAQRAGSLRRRRWCRAGIRLQRARAGRDRRAARGSRDCRCSHRSHRRSCASERSPARSRDGRHTFGKATWSVRSTTCAPCATSSPSKSRPRCSTRACAPMLVPTTPSRRSRPSRIPSHDVPQGAFHATPSIDSRRAVGACGRSRAGTTGGATAAAAYNLASSSRSSFRNSRNSRSRSSCSARTWPRVCRPSNWRRSSSASAARRTSASSPTAVSARRSTSAAPSRMTSPIPCCCRSCVRISSPP